MNIAIDANEANVKNRVGVNQYAFGLLWGLSKLQKKEKSQDNFIVYLKNPPLLDLPQESKHFTYRVIPGKTFWILTKLMPELFLARKKLNILFSLSHYTVPVSPVPRICSIMDLGYLNFSEHFKKTTFWQLKYWTAISIFVSKHIIAISENTRREIVRHYPFASKKISVIYPSYDKDQNRHHVSPKDVRQLKEKYSIPAEYILFLGTLKPSKNVERLLGAFDMVRNTNLKGYKDLRLVLAGKRGWLYQTIDKVVEEKNLGSSVVFTGFVSEKDKEVLIAGAKVFAAPSLWEGFGMNVLEAMAVGVPVLVGRSGSLPELVGNSGIFVDAESEQSIARGLIKILLMAKERYNKLVKRGIKRAGDFSWEDSAKKTLEIIRKVAG